MAAVLRIDSALLGTTEVRGASMVSSVINLANTIMGTGALALPFAFANSGIVSGTLFLCLSTALAVFSLHLLSLTAHRVGRPATFYSVCEAAHPRLPVVVDCIVLLNGFFACVGFLIISSDNLSMLSAGALPRPLWTLIGLAIVAPLCSLRKLKFLQYTSALSFVVLFFLTLLILLFSLNLDVPMLKPCGDTETEGSDSSRLHMEPGESSSMGPRPHVEEGECRGSVHAFAPPLSTFRSFATFIIAFTCQQNIFSVTNELDDPTPDRCLAVIIGAVSLALTLYCIIGYAGYLTFGSRVQDDILDSYPRSSLVDAARAGMALVVLTCFPLQAFAARTSLFSLVNRAERLYAAYVRGRVATPTPLSVRPDSALRNEPTLRVREIEANEHQAAAVDASGCLLTDYMHLEPKELGVIAAFLLVTTSTALVVTSLGQIVDVNGSLAGTAITFIVPGLVYYMTHKEERKKPKGYGAIGMVLFGWLFMPSSLSAVFLRPPSDGNVTLVS